MCKHVRKGIAEPVNKSGECQICRNARLKAKAGIKVGRVRCGTGTPVFWGLPRGVCFKSWVRASPHQRRDCWDSSGAVRYR